MYKTSEYNALKCILNNNYLFNNFTATDTLEIVTSFKTVTY